MPPHRIDPRLLSQQLQPWVTAAWDSLTQTAGYPGDHIGVGVTLTAPGGTCFGRTAWRLPLQILDDEAFCDDMAAMILQFIVLMQLQMIRLNDHRNRGSAQDAPRPCLHWGEPSRGNQP